ncbi:MAG: cupin domain-containing protein [Acidobacteria bacterium]|nr:cupin domain-containing protein [Acidobacteriota bacterium]MBV9071901.1 cupin domain-containing protein [Acidobacteriota bacterium]MBV9188302.1 cupin domain-containing protein [Acidobacteriota bacterium]
MLAILDGGCRVVGLKDGKPAVEGALRIWKHFGTAAGARAISLRVMELPAGERATLRNEAADEVLYVISGSGPGLRSDTGIYLPPATSFEIAADETLTLVSSRCPDDGARLDGNELGHGELFAVAMEDRPVQRTGDRWYREVINDDAGSTQVTQFVGGIPPGRAPDHFHLYEEVIVILDGTGEMWAGTSHAPIETGSCIFLPHGQVHCVENRGLGEMRLLGVFYPAGSPAVRYSAGS